MFTKITVLDEKCLIFLTVQFILEQANGLSLVPEWLLKKEEEKEKRRATDNWNYSYLPPAPTPPK